MKQILFQNGYDIRTVKELLGYKDFKTATMIHTHVPNRGGKCVHLIAKPTKLAIRFANQFIL
jgi:site-specific recombinase XerD